MALVRPKHNNNIPFITSPSGGIAPQGLAHLKLLARSSRLAGGRDGTSYGLARTSPRSFFTHHLQRISSALVRAAARDISDIISDLGAQSSSARLSASRRSMVENELRNLRLPARLSTVRGPRAVTRISSRSAIACTIA